MLEEKGKEYKQRLESVNEVLGEDMDLGVFKDVDELESVVGGLEKEIGDKERDLKGFLDLPSVSGYDMFWLCVVFLFFKRGSPYIYLQTHT